MGFRGISEQIVDVNREIRYRRMIIESAAKIGCQNLPTIAENRDEIDELEQIRANLEAIQGGVK